jgi:hypothetical protein
MPKFRNYLNHINLRNPGSDNKDSRSIVQKRIKHILIKEYSENKMLNLF